MGVIDLRSDTITQPTPEMRRAMADAEVGDDYYLDDPTVIRLEERAAGLLGKEAALLVLSGTMGNLVSVLTLVPHGSSAIAEATAHILINETGHLASICGLSTRPVRGTGGFLSPGDIETAMFPDSVLHPPTRLLCVENTHNAAGGRCLAPEPMRALSDAARRHGLAVHVDGARIFNAAVALGVDPVELAAPADTITFCLTKGLSAPAGSLVCGSRAAITEARRWRQMVGGGMRQAGVFAAAGLVALETGIDRLAEDHDNARRFATLLAGHGLSIDPGDVETNILFAEIPQDLMPARDFVDALAAAGIRTNPPKGNRVRFLLNRHVSRGDVETAGEAVGRLLDERRAQSRGKQ